MTEETVAITTLADALEEIKRLRRIVTDNAATSAPDTPPPPAAQPPPTQQKSLQLLFLHLLLMHTPNMVFLFDDKMQYVLGSSACQRLTRMHEIEMAGKPVEELFHRVEDTEWVGKIIGMMRSAFLDLKPVSFHDTLSLGDIAIINAHITISPTVDDAGVCRGSIMTINDVTELFQARSRAEEAAKSKASFLANMSHEIRTPMNAIKGLSELLQLTPLNTMQKNYVKTVVGSANSLMIIINDILDFSKIDANKIEFISASYSLHKLLSELTGIIGLRAEQKGLDLFLEVSPTVPARLIGDENRVKQILLNLLSNAIKYTPSGKVVFRMSSQPRADGRVDLVCAVEDTGIGIKPEDASFVFDAFSRADLKANQAIQGTGLGLAISKRLAAAMGGGITLASVYAEGSTFTLTVPHEIAAETGPLASVEGAEVIRVLLLGSNPRMMNAALMLDQLGVPYAFMDDSGTDVGIVRKLSQGSKAVPVVGEKEIPFSHGIYYDIISERDLTVLRENMPECRFACLRSILNSLQEPGGRDTMLFTPLLINDLAQFLNKGALGTSGRRGRHDTIISTRLSVHGARALVVDDNRINLLVCEKMLSVYGLEVKTASSGEEALALCKKTKFDILFVDHMMPGMDGIEVTAEIRGNPGSNRKTPIVALTANVLNDMRSYYIKCGMDDFVGKPIESKELIRVLTHWLPAAKISTTLSEAKDSG